MKTYHCVVQIKTDMILDAENLKDAFKNVKESWKDLHDITLADSEITEYVFLNEDDDGISSIKGQKVLLTGLDDEKEIVTVVEDYGNGELLFSNGVLGRDEDCNYGKLPKGEI